MSTSDIKKINIRGVEFFSVNMEEAVGICEDFISEGGFHTIHTPNSEIVQLCIEKKEYYDIINSADLVIPDGAGVVLASRILHTPLVKGKVAGIELCENLIKLASEKGYRVFFLGGKPGIAEKASERMKAKYPGLIVSGTNDGYFKKTDSIEKIGNDTEEEIAVINKINDSDTDILLVCLGVPKQEVWMKAHRDKIKASLAGGFGGSFDIFAGVSKRAPKVFIKLRAEWLYRLIKEPKRIGRMMKLPKFILSTVFTKKNSK